jgi:hypothetical protein
MHWYRPPSVTSDATRISARLSTIAYRLRPEHEVPAEEGTPQQYAEGDSATAIRVRGIGTLSRTPASLSIADFSLMWIAIGQTRRLEPSCEFRQNRRTLLLRAVGFGWVYTMRVRHALRRRHQDRRWFIVPCTAPALNRTLLRAPTCPSCGVVRVANRPPEGMPLRATVGDTHLKSFTILRSD